MKILAIEWRVEIAQYLTKVAEGRLIDESKTVCKVFYVWCLK